MAIRQHARPERELLDIVLQYPGLENRISAEAALRELRALKWVVNRDSESLTLTVQSPDLREQIGRIVRIDVYDPNRQRSLQGIMLELANPQGLDLNLVRIFLELFRGAWDRAKPVTLPGRIVWRLRVTWKLWIGLLFAALAFIPTGFQGWIELTAGIAAAFLSTALIEYVAAAKTRRRRRHHIG
jgi:hypothetical protein